MPFEFKKFASHGTSNSIVARLSLQNNLEISGEVQGNKRAYSVGGLYGP